jgi:site-specific DNA-methyltransferase (adenine-specific)
MGLTIADPPYGESYARGKNGWGVCDNRPTLQDVKWDKEIPQKEFFDELLRVSDKVIIWGGNYFTHLLPVSKCWLVWDKCNGTTNKSVFADAELAWTNMTKVVKMFHLRQMGFISDTKDGKRIHPTQKPTELYEWLIKNYAKDGDTIFDPMAGSFSSRIAAYRLGYDYVGCEIDKNFFNKAEERFKQETSQLSLF